MTDDPTTAPSADSASVPVASPVAPVSAPPATQVPDAPAAAPEPSKTDAIVDRWFAECVQGTAVGRYTDAYNAIYAALPELKARLTKEN